VKTTLTAAYQITLEYRTAPIYKNINLLMIPMILICQKDGATTSQAKPVNAIMQRIGLSLLKILKNEYGDIYENPATRDIASSVMTHRNPLLAETPPLLAIKTLKAQLNAYNQGYPPFDRPFQSKSMLLYTWWEHVQRHEDGTILGVIIYLGCIVKLVFTDVLDLGSCHEDFCISSDIYGG
jgi:hypothetical protein